MKKKAILTILDGYGIGEDSKYNAVKNAATPNLDQIFAKYSHSELNCSGESVGLPKGTMGNSEVGHLNMGAGRIVYQDISRINNSIRDKTFNKNPKLVSLIDYYEKNNCKIHLMGLVSDGNVHSSLEHIKALVDFFNENQMKRLFIHAFTDGRDTPPKSGLGYLTELADYLKNKTGEIASVMGRFYAMDRDNRWERIKLAYDALVYGKGKEFASFKEVFEESYQNEITDEFIVPSVITQAGEAKAKIADNDIVIFFNFRSDRAREISIALNDENFEEFTTKKLNLKYLTMTKYREDFTFEVLFDKVSYKNILGEVVAAHNLHQLRIAETEKYAHVTFFFNGGIDTEFKNETRILISSPKVETYDLKPEMSANEVTDKVIEALAADKYSLIILNFANCDMVGHTGIYEAALKAVETVDKCVGRIYKTAKENGYQLLITADHGNSEQMRDLRTDVPFTAHTTNKVPFLITDENIDLENGSLCDIAPTILKLLDLKQPSEMTGRSLIKEK